MLNSEADKTLLLLPALLHTLRVVVQSAGADSRAEYEPLQLVCDAIDAATRAVEPAAQLADAAVPAAVAGAAVGNTSLQLAARDPHSLVSAPGGALRGACAQPAEPSGGLKPATEEQLRIVDLVMAGTHNVVVSAVAGSGKTTTTLHVAKRVRMSACVHSCCGQRCHAAGSEARACGGRSPVQAQQAGLRVLLLTYNKRLKEEVRAKTKELGLKEALEVHNYHAFGVKYYDEECKHDLGRVVADRVPPQKPFRYDIIIVDEAQDITLSLFAFLRKVLLDNGGGGAACRMIFLGDPRQTIFQARMLHARARACAHPTHLAVSANLYVMLAVHGS